MTDGNPSEDEFDALMAASSLGSPRVPRSVDAMAPEDRDRLVRAVRRAELEQLMEHTYPTGWQLRRIAELAEALYDFSTAYAWWKKAAAAGNQDAIDMVKVFDENGNEKEN